jgi:S1-C subfamily serine protease
VTISRGELKRLQARADRSLVDVDVTSLFTQWRRVIGPPPEEMGRLAQEARDAIRSGQTPTPAQRQALEQAIRLLRPAPLVKAGELPPLDAPASSAFPDWAKFREAVKQHIPSVGRIDRAALPRRDPVPVATGFLIGPTTIATNSHVVDALTFGTGALVSGQAEVRFGQEYGPSPEPAAIAIEQVLVRDEKADLAVLSLVKTSIDRSPIPIADRTMQEGMTVAAIGFPMDEVGHPEMVLAMLDGIFQVKRASPGEVTGRKGTTMYHDCTTLAGNSGSPIFALDSGEVVAVHANGMYLARNRGPTGRALAFLCEHAA